MYALDGLRTHKGTIPTKWLARMHYGLMARSIYNGLAYTVPYVQEQHTAQLFLRYKPSVFVPAPTRVDCSLILEASASTPHVTRAPCSQHVPHESGSIWAEPGCAERRC